MKIGVITWFTGPNYGTNLQAIALQHVLRQAGHEAMIINYDEKLIYQFTPKKLSFMEKLKNKFDVYTMKEARLYYRLKIQKRDRLLIEAIRKKCLLTRKVSSNQEFAEICKDFDLLIVGSDQLWNPNWYVPLYYADYDGVDVRKISYAPSIGVNSIPDNKLRVMKQGLAGFSAVSVREKSGAELIRKISPVKPVRVTDPTLLLNKADWDRLFPYKQRLVKEKYALSVILTDNLFHYTAAFGFAHRKKLELAIVPYMGLSYFQPCKVFADTDLKKLLNLIRNAEYIVTDSYHITVFSIIYRKQFYVFKRFKEDMSSSTNKRVSELLEMLGLSDRFIKHNSCRIPNMKAIDYSKVIPMLKKEIKASEEYLFDAVNESRGEKNV